MSLDTLLNVSISLSATAAGTPGFGAALIAAYHTVGGAARVLGPFGSLAAVVTGGFASTTPVYFAASRYFAQTPTPTTLYIGRRATAFTQAVTLTPLTATAGTVVKLTVGATMGVGGTVLTRTIPGSSSISAECTAWAALINGLGGSPITAVAGSTNVVCTTATAGVLVEYQNTSPTTMGYQETTASLSGALAADLTAMWAANQQWYGLILDSNSDNEIEEAAAWVESNKRLFAPHSCSTEIFDSSNTTDIASVLKASSYTRTGLIAVQNSNMSYAGAALTGRQFTQVPGSDTWAYKNLASVAADQLPPGWDVNANNKFATVYIPLGLAGAAAANATVGGYVAAGTYFDVIRFVDWQRADMQARFLNLLLQNGKIPFDDDGIEMFNGQMVASLNSGVNVGGLASFSTTVPLASSITAANLAARNLTGLSFAAVLAGAIQELVLNGTVVN